MADHGGEKRRRRQVAPTGKCQEKNKNGDWRKTYNSIWHMMSEERPSNI